MTKYSLDELNGDWEFKIVRAETPVFRKSEAFQRLLQEEALAGWQLVEKLDDMRVRFKRSPSARKRDAMLPEGVDPYRTRYGGSMRVLLMGAIMLVLLGAIGAGIVPVILSEGFKSPVIVIAIVVLAGVVLGVFTLVMIRLRK